MVPYYVENNKDDISTGDPEKDNIIKMLLANPNLAGGFLACFLDNTIPGTKDERGINAWQKIGDDIIKSSCYAEGLEVYEPLLPRRLKASKMMKYIPFLSYHPKPKDELHQDQTDLFLNKMNKNENH